MNDVSLTVDRGSGVALRLLIGTLIGVVVAMVFAGLDPGSRDATPLAIRAALPGEAGAEDAADTGTSVSTE
jgi:hypothetical protein